MPDYHLIVYAFLTSFIQSHRVIEIAAIHFKFSPLKGTAKCCVRYVGSVITQQAIDERTFARTCLNDTKTIIVKSRKALFPLISKILYSQSVFGSNVTEGKRKRFWFWLTCFPEDDHVEFFLISIESVFFGMDTKTQLSLSDGSKLDQSNIEKSASITTFKPHCDELV